MNLVLVESKSKTKIIEDILNSMYKDKYKVLATGGHLENLIKNKLGINENFEPEYELLSNKKELIKEIKKLKFKELWIATDQDFEGEKIAESIITIFKIKNYKRVYFNEITKKAIVEAFNNPFSNLNQFYLDCQLTRRVIDRLLGYKLSPILWKIYGNNYKLSIGRVQSAVLLLINENENNIKNFQFEKKYECNSFYTNQIKCSLYKNNSIFYFNNEQIGIDYIKSLDKNFTINQLPISEILDYPSKPFITSTLQQEAYHKLKFNLKKTMSIAQELYEKGKITYPRTDSFTISNSFLEIIKIYINKNYPNYLNIHYAKNNSNAQLAHEAIRPTYLNENNTNELSEDCQKLYKLIFKRTIAYYLKPAIYEILKIKINHGKQDEYFLYQIKKLKFNGYLILDEINHTEITFEKEIEQLKNIKCEHIELKEIISKIPKRYNEANLINIMEEKGIGRPATFQITIDKLNDKKLIQLKNFNSFKKELKKWIWNFEIIESKIYEIEMDKENNKFELTSQGKLLIEFINNYCQELINVNYTKKLEKDIDDILNNKIKKINILNNFNQELNNLLSKIKIIKSDNPYIKNGKYGSYIVCNDKNISIEKYLELSNKNIKEFGQEDYDFLKSFPIKIENDEICYGRYGFFYKNQKKSINFQDILKIYHKLK
jgi:DNA topoisomerase-1